jgi:hypothetical protein
MKAHHFSIAILLIVFLAGCKPKQTALTGQIFIVTRGAENIKLGGVEILLIEKSQAVDFLQRQTTVIQSEMNSRQQAFDVTSLFRAVRCVSLGRKKGPDE